MNQLTLGTLALSLLLAGCAAQPAPQAESQAASSAATEAATPALPSQSTTAQGSTPLPIEEWKFNGADGASLTQAELISKVKVSPDEFESPGKQYGAIFSRIESAVNYFPDEETVRTNLNIPAGQPLDREHYFTVVKEYQDTVFDTVIAGGGPLRTMADELGRQTAFNHGLTIGAGDKVLYKVSIKEDILLSQTVTIEDNGSLNSIGADVPGTIPKPNIGKFRYNSPTMYDLTVPAVPLNKDPATYQRGYQITGGVRLIELE